MSPEHFSQLSKAILDGDESAAIAAANAAIEADIDLLGLIKQGINEALDKIGQAFQAGELFLPELIMAGDAAKAASDVIMPHISADVRESVGEVRAVLGTIQGDMHDIGKNIVAAYLAASGVKVIDLGADVPPKRFVQEAQVQEAHIIAMSTLLTTTLPFFRQTMRLLEATDQRAKHFVIVGGGPVTPSWAKEIGADGYGRDAKDAVDLCTELMRRGSKPPLADPLVLGALK